MKPIHVRLTITLSAWNLHWGSTRGATIFPCLLALGAALCSAGCHRESRVDASRSLEQSFQDSEPEVKQAVVVATTSLRAGNYTEMARAMDPVLSTGRQLTPAQKQAVEQLFQQINQTLEADPSRDSKELYELRVKLHRAATGGRRF